MSGKKGTFWKTVSIVCILFAGIVMLSGCNTTDSQGQEIPAGHSGQCH